MRTLHKYLAAALSTLLSAGCGNDDTKSSSGDASSSCNSYCNKAGPVCTSEGDDAGASFADATECKLSECESLPKASECQAPYKAYYDCLNKADNPCNLAACIAEFYALPTGCI